MLCTHESSLSMANVWVFECEKCCDESIESYRQLHVNHTLVCKCCEMAKLETEERRSVGISAVVYC